ncbi:cytochrome Cbb3 [Sulfurifustis variabilis]|uniref:Cytochrome Cbb3 n=1 Tax=Sulfurifustis variabilis TaxID=1675686 RepID=A0A1B4VFM3_9GAMM|nr:sulfur oxidation c-type cytochrome SoxX [Sulfurifustis variabilis]BAU49547.1 cytochrome Cbb3 [Sulfurifustis variabilis]
MGKTVKALVGTTAAFLVGSLLWTTPAQAAGQVPDDKTCKDEEAVKKLDTATQGGCVVINRRKGNCMACHQIAGISSGNIAPPLVAMKQRFPDKAKLRAQISNPHQFNPDSVMPPFGEHKILSPDEIDKVVEFVLTL